MGGTIDILPPYVVIPSETSSPHFCNVKGVRFA